MSSPTHHLIDAFQTSDDEHSGVRVRSFQPRITFLDGDGHVPTSVFVVHDDGCHFLGTRFANGIITAEDWDREMQRAGAPLGVIRAAAEWLRQQAI